MYDFADSWPWGSLSCGCELDLNSLIPSETTGISGSLPPACNETFGKNKGDVNTKDTKDMKMEKFCVFPQVMSVLSSWCASCSKTGYFCFYVGDMSHLQC